MSNWDGKERRAQAQMDLELRDKIISTHTNVQAIKEWTVTHDKKDDDRFHEVDNKLSSLYRFMWIGIGAIGVIEFMFKFLK